MQTVRRSPGLEDFWQLHWSYNGALEQNSAGVFIANMDDPATIAGVLTAPPRGGPGARRRTSDSARAGAASTARRPELSLRRAAAPPAASAGRGCAPQGRGRNRCRAAHARLLDQDLRAAGRDLYGLQQPERIQQDLQPRRSGPIQAGLLRQREAEEHVAGRQRDVLPAVDRVADRRRGVIAAGLKVPEVLARSSRRAR